MKRYSFYRSKYHYCSVKCHAEHKKITFKGEGNHQYGLKGPLNKTFKNGILKKNNNHLIDNLIFVGFWYRGNIHGRTKTYRYLVEKHHHLYDEAFFEVIDGWHYLKSGIEVHHIDFDHTNNELSNLMPMPKGEHVKLHNIHRGQSRDNITGKFIKNDTKRVSKQGS